MDRSRLHVPIRHLDKFDILDNRRPDIYSSALNIISRTTDDEPSFLIRKRLFAYSSRIYLFNYNIYYILRFSSITSIVQENRAIVTASYIVVRETSVVSFSGIFASRFSLVYFFEKVTLE